MLLFTCSCSNAGSSRDLLIEKLSLPYSATASFIISDGKENTSGSANVTRSDITTVTFTEPSAYSGISIRGDNSGKQDIFSFELSGIPTAVPKTIAGELSLIFSLFSDDIIHKIDTLEKEAFRKSGTANDKGNGLIEVFFSQNGTGYVITYDSHTGTPYSFDAGNDETSVSIVLSDFTQTNHE